MKIIGLITTVLLAVCLPMHAQLQIKGGGSISVNGSASIQFHNTGLENNGEFNPGTGSVIFTGDAPVENSMISGDGVSFFHDLIIDKDTNGIMLDAHIEVANVLGFSNGGLHLNSFDVDLGTDGHLIGEHDYSRVISDDGGVVRALREVTQSTEEHFGNLGLFLTSEEYLGWCTVERGHEAVDIGSLNTIDRHYYFQPEIDEDHGVQIQKDYFHSDIDNHDEDDLKLFQQIDSVWFEHDNHFHDTLSNSYFSDGVATESIISLAHEEAITTSTKEKVLAPIRLSIWPNPTSTEFNIDLGDSFQKGQYAILRNVNGQIIKMMTIQDKVTKIEHKGIAAGIYFLEMKQGSSIIGVEKIIIK